MHFHISIKPFFWQSLLAVIFALCFAINFHEARLDWDAHLDMRGCFLALAAACASAYFHIRHLTNACCLIVFRKHFQKAFKEAVEQGIKHG